MRAYELEINFCNTLSTPRARESCYRMAMNNLAKCLTEDDNGGSCPEFGFLRTCPIKTF
jgi:hypothetical protein